MRKCMAVTSENINNGLRRRRDWERGRQNHLVPTSVLQRLSRTVLKNKDCWRISSGKICSRHQHFPFSGETGQTKTSTHVTSTGITSRNRLTTSYLRTTDCAPRLDSPAANSDHRGLNGYHHIFACKETTKKERGKTHWVAMS